MASRHFWRITIDIAFHKANLVLRWVYTQQKFCTFLANVSPKLVFSPKKIFNCRNKIILSSRDSCLYSPIFLFFLLLPSFIFIVELLSMIFLFAIISISLIFLPSLVSIKRFYWRIIVRMDARFFRIKWPFACVKSLLLGHDLSFYMSDQSYLWPVFRWLLAKQSDSAA